MVRRQISLFLLNAPGELGRLTSLLSDAGVNIEAVSIQDASAYVQELMKARGKTIKRIASTQSYDSMRRDSEEFALIRMLVDNTEKAVDLLAANGYQFDLMKVMVVSLEDKPGSLAEMASRFGSEGINIQYVYGSVMGKNQQPLFIFRPDDIELAAKVFGEEE